MITVDGMGTMMGKFKKQQVHQKRVKDSDRTVSRTKQKCFFH